MALGVGWKDAAPSRPHPLQTERPPIGVRLGGVTIAMMSPDGGGRCRGSRWLPGLTGPPTDPLAVHHQGGVRQDLVGNELPADQGLHGVLEEAAQGRAP